jgi:hypothetical protein
MTVMSNETLSGVTGLEIVYLLFRIAVQVKVCLQQISDLQEESCHQSKKKERCESID